MTRYKAIPVPKKKKKKSGSNLSEKRMRRNENKKKKKKNPDGDHFPWESEYQLKEGGKREREKKGLKIGTSWSIRYTYNRACDA